MELIHDWKSFQETFNKQRRLPAPKDRASQAAIYCIVEGEQVLTAYSEHEALSQLQGRAFREVASQFANRKVISLSRENVDHVMGQALPLPHLYDQVEFFRDQVKPVF